MIDIIITLGAVTYTLLAVTLVFLILFKIKRKRIFYKLHQGFGIVTAVLATTHGAIAGLYFAGLI